MKAILLLLCAFFGCPLSVQASKVEEHSYSSDEGLSSNRSEGRPSPYQSDEDEDEDSGFSLERQRQYQQELDASNQRNKERIEKFNTLRSQMQKPTQTVEPDLTATKQPKKLGSRVDSKFVPQAQLSPNQQGGFVKSHDEQIDYERGLQLQEAKEEVLRLQQENKSKAAVIKDLNERRRLKQQAQKNAESQAQPLAQAQRSSRALEVPLKSVAPDLDSREAAVRHQAEHRLQVQQGHEDIMKALEVGQNTKLLKEDIKYRYADAKVFVEDRMKQYLDKCQSLPTDVQNALFHHEKIAKIETLSHAKDLIEKRIKEEEAFNWFSSKKNKYFIDDLTKLKNSINVRMQNQ